VLVTPAKAGVQFVYLIFFTDTTDTHWIPASPAAKRNPGCVEIAGMTSG
jgi:hypothetical protein